MAEFNDPADPTFRYWGTPKEKEPADAAMTPPADLDAFKAPPEVTRLNRALAILPLLVLAVVLVLLLAGCKSDKRPTAGTSSTTTTQQQPGAADPLQDVVASVSTAVAGIAPGTNSTPVFVWDFANSPTPYPSATPDTNCSHISTCGWDVMQNGGGK